MWMVQLIAVVLMMLEFVHALPMSLQTNVMFVQLVGMVSLHVKVKYVIECVFVLYLLFLKNIFRVSM